MASAVGEYVALILGFTAVAGVAWRWMVHPAFARAVQQIVQAENAAALKPVIDELSYNTGKSVKDVVNRIDGRLEDHIRLHERSGDTW